MKEIIFSQTHHFRNVDIKDPKVVRIVFSSHTGDVRGKPRLLSSQLASISVFQPTGLANPSRENITHLHIYSLVSSYCLKQVPLRFHTSKYKKIQNAHPKKKKSLSTFWILYFHVLCAYSFVPFPFWYVLSCSQIINQSSWTCVLMARCYCT